MSESNYIIMTEDAVDLTLMSPNSILMIKTETPLTDHDMDKLRLLLPAGPMVLSCRPGDSLKTFSEADMNDMGWFYCGESA